MIRGLAEKLGLTKPGDVTGELALRLGALDRARASRDSRVRPAEPTVRQIARRQSRTAATDARKRRRRAFLQAQAQRKADELARTWARVYLVGAGNDEVRRNVTAAVHRQAELFSKVYREPFTTSLKRVEGILLTASQQGRRSR